MMISSLKTKSKNTGIFTIATGGGFYSRSG
jgi:hypothetical protein